MASLDKEFALFVESEKQQRGQLLDQAKTIKTLAIAGVVLIALLFLAAMVWLLIKRHGGTLPSQ